MARRPAVRKKSAEGVATLAPGKMFAVTLCHGPAWNTQLGMEMQPGWDLQAAYMDRLAAEGFVFIGGPLDDTPYVLIAVRAESAAEAGAKLAGDPWVAERRLEITRVAPWTLRLGAARV